MVPARFSFSRPFPALSLTSGDAVLSAVYHTIRVAQGTQVPWLSRDSSKKDDRLKAVISLAWWRMYQAAALTRELGTKATTYGVHRCPFVHHGR